ncbi:MAG TPA: hypothetical protein VNQ99_07775 [Xanthobacteraceae bacterium]|nr:hypothetical protein [Xanthobacteraceae bacterium]
MPTPKAPGMLILDLLLEFVGYTTARLILPVVTLRRVYVQPVRAMPAAFNLLGFRPDGQGRLEIEATAASWIGLALWLLPLAGIILLIN